MTPLQTLVTLTAFLAVGAALALGGLLVFQCLEVLQA